MPSIYTHYKFGIDVLAKLDKNTQNLIRPKKDYYYIFNQSFDTLYYYNFLSLKKGSDIRSFAHHAHRCNTNKFFANAINYIIDNSLEENSEVMVFLYGFLNHYALDTTMHPYLNYKSGRYNPLDKSTKKYKGVHTTIEIMLDKYMYEKNTKLPWNNYKIYHDFLKKLEFSSTLVEALNTIFKDTFDKENIGNIYNISNNQSALIYRLLVKDKCGIKKKGYKMLDFFTPNKDSLYSSFSWYIKEFDTSLLNKNHLPWCNPVSNEEMYEDSFMELYLKAQNYAINLINETNKVIFERKNINALLDLLGNKNYETGLPISDKRLLKYFEF